MIFLRIGDSKGRYLLFSPSRVENPDSIGRGEKKRGWYLEKSHYSKAYIPICSEPKVYLTQVSHVNSLVLQGGDIEANTDCYVVHDVTYCE